MSNLATKEKESCCFFNFEDDFLGNKIQRSYHDEAPHIWKIQHYKKIKALKVLKVFKTGA